MQLRLCFARWLPYESILCPPLHASMQAQTLPCTCKSWTRCSLIQEQPRMPLLKARFCSCPCLAPDAKAGSLLTCSPNIKLTFTWPQGLELRCWAQGPVHAALRGNGLHAWRRPGAAAAAAACRAAVSARAALTPAGCCARVYNPAGVSPARCACWRHLKQRRAGGPSRPFGRW